MCRMQGVRGFVPALFILFLCVSTTHARLATDYSKHLHWTNRIDLPGTPVSLAIRAPYGYLTDQYYGLRVLGFDDPDHPVEVGSVALPGQSWGVSLYDDYACVTVYDQGLCIVDVKDPQNPIMTGSVWSTSALGIAVQGKYAYMTDFADMRLYTVSLADPTNPEIVGECQTLSWAWDVAVCGKLAVVSASSSVVIVDISNPLDPVRIGRLTLPDAGLDVAVEGHYAYIAGTNGFLFVVDFQDPRHPALAAEIAMPSVNWTVAVRDGFVFLGRQENGLNVYDVHDPAHPVFAGHFPIDGRSQAWGLEFLGDRLYVVERYGSMHVLQAGNPRAVLPAAVLPIPDPRAQIAIGEPYAYLADGAEGLIVVDLRDPASPSIVNQMATGSMGGITQSEGYLYASGGNQGFMVYDLSEPQEPVLVGSCNIGAGSGNIAIQDGYAYVADGGRIVDIHDPSAPRLVATMSSGNDVELHGDLAYVCGGGQVFTVNISDPTHPHLISTVAATFPLHCMTSDNGHLYVGGESTEHPYYTGRIGVLSLDDPLHPSWIAELSMMNKVENLERSGKHLWASQDYQPVALVDISQPDNPRVSGMCELAERMGDITWDIAVGKDFVLGACYALEVMPCNVPVSPFSGPPARSPFVPAGRSALLGRPGASIDLEVEGAGDRGDVSRVFDASGRVVRELARDARSSLGSPLRWDMRDGHGRQVAAGVYFITGTGRRPDEPLRVVVLP